MDWSIFEAELPMVYGKHSIIYDQGDEATRFYYLKRGRVRIFLSSEDGAERTLMLIEDGALFGEAAFFDGLPRVSSAKTMEKSEIIAVDRAKLAAIFAQRPDAAMQMLSYLAMRVRLLSAQVDSMTFLQADHRIAELLLQLADERGQVQMTHEALADLAGVSRITVSKILARFKRLGLLETGYRSVRLTARTKLQQFRSDGR